MACGTRGSSSRPKISLFAAARPMLKYRTTRWMANSTSVVELYCSLGTRDQMTWCSFHSGSVSWPMNKKRANQCQKGPGKWTLWLQQWPAKGPTDMAGECWSPVQGLLGTCTKSQGRAGSNHDLHLQHNDVAWRVSHGWQLQDCLCYPWDTCHTTSEMHRCEQWLICPYLGCPSHPRVSDLSTSPPVFEDESPSVS